MLLLVRHGLSQANYCQWLLDDGGLGFYGLTEPVEDDWHRKLLNLNPERDPGLMPLGAEQAKEGGRFLVKWLFEQNLSLGAVAVSPFKRTIQTASYMLAETEYAGKVILDPLAREIYAGSEFDQGSPRSQVMRLIESGSLFNPDRFDVSALDQEIWFSEKLETYKGTEERADTFLKKYAEIIISAKDVLLCVSHAGIIRKITGYVKDIMNCDIIVYDPEGPGKRIFRPSYETRHQCLPGAPEELML